MCGQSGIYFTIEKERQTSKEGGKQHEIGKQHTLQTLVLLSDPGPGAKDTS